MKAGDLVRFKHWYRGGHPSQRFGVVEEYLPAEGFLSESVWILWSDGDRVIEAPTTLKVISESQ